MCYDRDKFSWDEYRAKCLAHQKSLTQLLFVKGAKSVVQEFYKQKSHQHTEQRLVFTAAQVTDFLSHFRVHLPHLEWANSLVKIEPLLLVYFSDFNF